MNQKMIVILNGKVLSFKRLPKVLGEDGLIPPRYHELRYQRRTQALWGYWVAAGRLDDQGRLHKASCIES